MFVRRILLIGCTGLFLFACMAATLGLSVLSRALTSRAEAQSASKIVYGLTLMPSGFDPHINASAELGIPLRSVYDTLVYRDPLSKNFIPGLAEGIEIAPDGLTYTFKLKSGVSFHDGTPFDAAAVAANLDRITNPETKSQKALFLLGPYDKYIIVDPTTIQIVLKSPYTPLLDGLAQVYLGMASPKALAEYDRDRYQLHQVGTGPYRFVEYIPGDRLTLQRNPDYTWGPEFYSKENASPVQEIEFRFFTDPATRAPALESDAAQVMGEIPPTDATLLSRDDRFTLLPQSIPGLPFQFFFNTSLAPTNSLDLRRALITATNRTAIVDSLFEQFSPTAYGPLSAQTPFYDARVRDFYPYDQRAAQRALLLLGYNDNDNDGFLDKDGQKFTLVLVVPSWSYAPQIAQKLQSQWKAIGIDLEIRQVPGLAGIREAMQENSYHLIAFNDYGVEATVLNTFYRADGINNFARVADGNLDGWLIRAGESLDPTDRQTLYASVQNLVMEQALIIPIRDYVNLNAASRKVGNLAYDAYGWFPLLWNMTLQSQ
jgi:peptide/nickel transport system substrate-binding protein